MHSVQTPGHMRTRSARTRAHAHTSTSTMRGHAHGRYLDAKDPKNSDEQEVDEDDVDTFGQRHKDKTSWTTSRSPGTCPIGWDVDVPRQLSSINGLRIADRVWARVPSGGRRATRCATWGRGIGTSLRSRSNRRVRKTLTPLSPPAKASREVITTTASKQLHGSFKYALGVNANPCATILQQSSKTKTT